MNAEDSRRGGPSRRTFLAGLGAVGLTAACDLPWEEDHPKWQRVPEPAAELKGHTEKITSAAFSPDGRLLATGSWDEKVILWTVATGVSAGVLQVGSTVLDLAFSPDGRTIALSTNYPYGVEFWDVARREHLRDLSEPVEQSLESLAFSPDGAVLVTGGADSTARAWDPATGKPLGPPLRHDAEVVAVAFSPDGESLATATEDAVFLWDPAEWKRRGERSRGHDLKAPAFTPDSESLAVAELDEVVLLDVSADLREERTLEMGSYPSSIAFTPDGRTLAAGFGGGWMRLFDVRTGRPVGDEFQPHTDSVDALAFSPDGSRLVTGSADGTATLWKP
ncbi:hypothetical protein GCM10022221_43280 [Actinocorallia aurea]